MIGIESIPVQPMCAFTSAGTSPQHTEGNHVVTMPACKNRLTPEESSDNSRGLGSLKRNGSLSTSSTDSITGRSSTIHPPDFSISVGRYYQGRPLNIACSDSESESSTEMDGVHHNHDFAIGRDDQEHVTMTSSQFMAPLLNEASPSEFTADHPMLSRPDFKLFPHLSYSPSTQFIIAREAVTSAFPLLSDNIPRGVQLGKGGYGTVFQVASDNILNGKVFALKVFDTTKKDGSEDSILLRRATREVNTHIRIKHPNIVPAICYLMHNTTVLLGMELAPQVLSTLLRQKQCDPAFEMLSTREEIFSGICNGVKYLHQALKIIHGDLKSPNVLLKQDNTPMISDFGLSSPIKEARTLLKTPVYYMDQKLTGADRIPMTTASDMFSLGVLMLELELGRYLPFIWSDRVKANTFQDKNPQWLTTPFYRHFQQQCSLYWMSEVNRQPLITDLFSTDKLISVCRFDQANNRTQLISILEEVVYPLLVRNPEDRPDINQLSDSLRRLKMSSTPLVTAQLPASSKRRNPFSDMTNVGPEQKSARRSLSFPHYQ